MVDSVPKKLFFVHSTRNHLLAQLTVFPLPKKPDKIVTGRFTLPVFVDGANIFLAASIATCSSSVNRAGQSVNYTYLFDIIKEF